MTDLDRRIAELKGWRHRKDKYLGEGFEVDTPMGMIFRQGPWWSTSDAKALELVDEVLLQHGFTLTRQDKTGLWIATFTMDSHYLQWAKGQAPTRPEAICRAWVAAQEWLLAQNTMPRKPGEETTIKPRLA